MAENGLTVVNDLKPEISIDLENKLKTNIDKLRELLGIIDLQPVAEGSTLKIYKWNAAQLADQVDEGETIGLSKVTRVLDRTITLGLKKYRRATSAEAIQAYGSDLAINQSDERLMNAIQGKIKGQFFTELLASAAGTPITVTTGKGLQKTLAEGWGSVQDFFQDYDATPIYFVHTDDVAAYLAQGNVTMQTAFGISYIENFLGLGDVIVLPNRSGDESKIWCTAKENLRGAYVPVNKGDIASEFGLTSDETGLVGMKHSADDTNATINTLIMAGIAFYPEMADGVFEINVADYDSIGA